MHEPSGLRRWWGMPRSSSERNSHRKVTFLELFYDLVYVVLLSRVSHHLADHPDLTGLGQSAFLFLLLWLAWVNGTVYHELHGDENVRTRVFTFLQMTAVAGMAIFTHTAFGTGAVGFAICVASFQLILTVLWWRTGSHQPERRPVSRPYAVMYLLSALLFAASVAAPLEARHGLWGAGLFASVALPLYRLFRPPRDPRVLVVYQRSLEATPSLLERFGLLTIVALGEVIAGIVQGASTHHHLGTQVVVAAVAGLGLAIGLWWLYFDFVSEHEPVPGARTRAWMYLHLPVTAGLGATGAAVLDLLENVGGVLPVEERWLVVGAVAWTQLGLMALLWTLELARRHRRLIVGATALLALSSVGTLGLGWTQLGILELLLAMDALLLLPVGYALFHWVRAVTARAPG